MFWSEITIIPIIEYKLNDSEMMTLGTGTIAKAKKKKTFLSYANVAENREISLHFFVLKDNKS